MRFVLAIWALLTFSQFAGAANYWVAPDGDDGNNGLDSTTAWVSIDNGDVLGVIAPGDTVNILAGNYVISRYLQLTTSGTAASPIVYHKFGTGDAILNANNYYFQVDANHVEVSGLELTNANINAIILNGDSCTLSNLFIHDTSNRGISVSGSGNLILKVVLSDVSNQAIYNSPGGENNRYYGNTIEDANTGISALAVGTARIFNTIIVGVSTGIKGESGNICGFNDIWDFTVAAYSNGVADSAGGISADPLFVAPDLDNFQLGIGSPCIDSGLDLGYPYEGSAPDMGALETPEGNHDPVLYFIGPKSIYANENITFAVFASDAESTPTLTTSALPAGAGFTDNSDGSGEFEWTPGNLQYGTHEVTFYATDDSAAVDSEMVEFTVNSLKISIIPLGNRFVYPTETLSPLLTFQIDNLLPDTIHIEQLAFRDGSRGAGSLAERLSNLDSIFLYLDTDNDSLLTPADSLIASIAVESESTVFSLPPLAVDPVSSMIIMADAVTSLFPHDGDSLDLYLFLPDDIVFGDTMAVIESDSVNSLGYNIINGMIADQLSLITTGQTYIGPGDSLHNVLTIDIPRNGYLQDTLQIFNVWNAGTASNSDLDSMILFIDDGNGSWGGAAEDTRLGRMSFTGNRWSISGLNTVLVDQLTRFFVTVNLADYPVNGATLAPGVPLNGIDMASNNDGPLDSPLFPIDTITIQSSEAVSVTAIPIPSREIIPGESTGPILGLELINSYSGSVAIDSIRCNLFATDPDGASQAQLDSQIDSLLLYHNLDGNYNQLGIQDTLIAVAALNNGILVFETPNLLLAGAGGTIGLTVIAELNADNAKNDNSINIGIIDTTGLFITPHSFIAGDFPLQNQDDFIINAFPVASVEVNAINSATFYSGQTNKLALDFELPGNGYAIDSLKSLRLVNFGTIDDDYITPRLWADHTGNGYTADDINLGQLNYSSSFWSIGNLTRIINPSGAQFLITVDIAGNSFEGGTLQLAVPTGGVEYRSGTTGADNGMFSNPVPHLVFPANRVTVISVSQPTSSVIPGSAENVMLTFGLYNGYLDETQNLQRIRLSNVSHSKSSPDFSDSELGQVSLFFDSNKNKVLDNDSLLASGYFNGGLLQLSGFDIQIAAESLFYFFVSADIPENVIDSDSLAISIASHSDIGFSDAVSINGDLPVTSGGYFIINGSVHSQYEEIELTPRTLSPGDTSVTLFAFRPALNGNLTDTLQSLTIENLGDADTSDITSMGLWLDLNGDDIWQSSDLQVGLFTFAGGLWTTDPVEIEIAGIMPGLFVLADVKNIATPDVSFQGSIPLNGCQYKSENDGPHDFPLNSTAIFDISNSSLMVSSSLLQNTFSIGQSIELRLTARNILSVPIDSAYGQVVYIENPAGVISDSSAPGPVALAPGESHDFAFYYTAAQTGDVFWRLRAVAPGIPDSSAIISTDSITIQAPPAEVSPNLISTIPAAVIRGQSNVFPLSVRCSHPDTEYTAASLRLDSLRFGIEDGSGTPVIAGEVFSRMILSTGYTNLAIIDNVPSQPAVSFIFNNPVIVSPGQQRLYTLLVDIDSAATAANFVLTLEDATAILLTDANTGQPVPINGGVAFPLKTASCHIDDPSQQMVVSYTSLLGGNVNYSQQNAGLIQLRLRHPGFSGSSQIQFIRLSFSLADSLMNPVEPWQILEDVTINRGQFTIGLLSDFVIDTAFQTIQLNSPLTLNPGDVDTIDIRVSVRDDALYGGLNFIINDSAFFEVRDLSSGSLLETATDTVIAHSGSIFPISSGWTEFKQPATPPEICVTSALAASIIGGVDSLSLINLSISYPSNSLHSSIRLRNSVIAVFDSLGTLLNPDLLFDRIGFRISDGQITYQPYIRTLYGSAVFDFSDTGLVVDPGDSLELILCADIESDVPYDHFILFIQNDEAINLRDATDTSFFPGIAIAEGCASDFPFSTDIVQIFLPAGRPGLEPRSIPAQIGFPGQTQLSVFGGNLQYNNPVPQGDLLIKGLSGRILKRTPDGLSVVSAQEIFQAIRFLIEDQEVAVDTIFPGDSLYVQLDSDCVVPWGSDLELSLTCDIKDNAAPGNYVISFDDSTFLDIVDNDFADAVYAALISGTYPLLSAEISISEANLENSFTNYPNPFFPSRGEATTIGFVLDQDACIDIKIYTITGETVKDVAINSYRPAGSYQSDTWSGVNSKGHSVVPGTYFCQITARFNSGKESSCRRKIAVIR